VYGKEAEKMHISIVTLFPKMFEALTEYGITSRALKAGLVKLDYWNPRDFTTDKHHTVDDKPFGGGPGMLMKTEPLQLAIQAARQSVQAGLAGADFTDGSQVNGDLRAVVKVVYLSPQGRKLDQNGAEELAACENMVLVCGRYQGIDERVLKTEVDEEWSLGDFVISGGELAAMVLVDAMTRLQPGALGAEDSVELDSFAEGLLHCPQYTRPQIVAGEAVPEMLLSGNHEQIRLWRLKQSLGATWNKRPDLLEKLTLDAEQSSLLNEYIDEYEASDQPSQLSKGSGVDK
jgi:tRNA (guanine37-N1)-methyltransferase